MLAFDASRNEAFTTLSNRYKYPLVGFFRRWLADSPQAGAVRVVVTRMACGAKLRASLPNGLLHGQANSRKRGDVRVC
jgi:hypothetical protein